MLVDAPGAGKTSTVVHAVGQCTPAPAFCRIKAVLGCMQALMIRLKETASELPPQMTAETLLDALRKPCVAAMYRVMERYYQIFTVTEVTYFCLRFFFWQTNCP